MPSTFYRLRLNEPMTQWVNSLTVHRLLALYSRRTVNLTPFAYTDCRYLPAYPGVE
jgi:hypothetical protein